MKSCQIELDTPPTFSKSTLSNATKMTQSKNQNTQVKRYKKLVCYSISLNYKDETFQSLRTPKRLIFSSKKREKLSDNLRSKSKYKSGKHKSAMHKSAKHKIAKAKKKVKFRFSKTKERKSTFTPNGLDSSVELYGMKVKTNDLAHYLSKPYK